MVMPKITQEARTTVDGFKLMPHSVTFGATGTQNIAARADHQGCDWYVFFRYRRPGAEVLVYVRLPLQRWGRCRYRVAG